MTAYPLPIPAGKFDASREQFESIVTFLESGLALQMPHQAVETHLVAEGRELQRRLYQDHMNLRGAAELRLCEVTGSDGVERRQAVETSIGQGSVFGGVRVPRLLYQAQTTDGLAPMDALLNLPTGYYSHGVRRLIAFHVANESYEEVIVNVREVTGNRIQKRQAEEIAISAARDFGDFYAQDSLSEAEVGLDSLIVMSFDGKGIVMREEDLREATRRAAAQSTKKLTKRLSKGEKRNRKRMAEVAAVYAIEPFVRETVDVVRELRPVTDVKVCRPKPSFKRVWASVVDEMTDAVEQAFSYAKQLDPLMKHKWVVLLDGNKEQLRIVQKVAREQGISVVILVDIIHVIEYLWKAAYCFHSEGSRAAEKWVTERLGKLLDGHDPGQIAAGMRRSATYQKLLERKALDACAKYFVNNRRWMNYSLALREGMPIATGVIEGACRYLVKDRMDRTGARWSLEGAEAVLRLRALRTNGDFDEYWAFHLNRELERNHLQAYLNNQPPNPLPVNDNGKAKLRKIK